MYTAALSYLHWTDWGFWSSTPRKLLACLDEFWYLDHLRSYEAAAYNLGFFGVMFSKDVQIPDPPERKNKPRGVVTTNDAGLALLEGMF